MVNEHVVEPFDGEFLVVEAAYKWISYKWISYVSKQPTDEYFAQVRGKVEENKRRWMKNRENKQARREKKS